MIKGRIILVTGTARRLGREIALHLAGQRVRLVLGDTDAQGGQAIADEITANGGQARFHAVDLGDPASITAPAESIKDGEGALHGLVNNGAIATGIGGKMYDEIDIDTWDRVMAVNLRGLWLMTRVCVALMAEGTRVVNMASDTALWGAPRLLSYVASKGAVMSMTRSLARELGTKGIGVTAIAPGILGTQSTEYVPQERHDNCANGRAVPGAQPPEDITGTVAFLLSDAALNLTGQVLPVNRGFVFT